MTHPSIRFLVITLSLSGLVAGLAAAVPQGESDRLRAASSPPAAGGVPGVAPSGERIYDQLCARCHGLEGRGDGPAAGLLAPRPTDFTGGVFKLRSTEPGSLPTRADLAGVIRGGAASMPAFEGLLSEAEIAAVVDRVTDFSPRFRAESPRPVELGDPTPATPEGVARGGEIYRRLGCATCHGTEGRGRDRVLEHLRDASGRPARVPRLDEPWSFTGGSSPLALARRLVGGLDGTPMPAYGDRLAQGEVWDLVSYVRSLARRPVWEMEDDRLAEFYDDGAGLPEEPVARGRYLVETMSCAACHTPTRTDGGPVEDLRFVGGMRFDVGPFGDVFSGNLTSDPETGIGEWTDEEIRRAISKGERPDGSYMLPFPMPWISYGTLAERDVEAIVAYLRTLPPIKNKVPENRPAGFFRYLWGKFEILILKRDFPSVTFSGNAGSAPLPETWKQPPVPVAAYAPREPSETYDATLAGGGAR